MQGLDFRRLHMIAIKKHIQKNGILPNDQVLKLIEKAQKGNIKARNAVIENNLGLVMKAAGKFPWFEDMFQEGIFGLIRAIELFDPKKAEHFSTYAMFWVKQRMGRYYDDNRSTVRLPVYLVQLQKRYHKLQYEDPDATNKFLIRLIAKQKGVKVSTALNAVKAMPRYTHIDDEEIKCQLAASVIPGDLDSIDAKRLMRSLDEREKFIILKRLDNYTLQEVAEELDISRERVRQIEHRALQKLKAIVAMKDRAYDFE